MKNNLLNLSNSSSSCGFSLIRSFVLKINMITQIKKNMAYKELLLS